MGLLTVQERQAGPEEPSNVVRIVPGVAAMDQAGRALGRPVGIEVYRVQKNRPHGQRISRKRKRHSPTSLCTSITLESALENRRRHRLPGSFEERAVPDLKPGEDNDGQVAVGRCSTRDGTL